MIFTRFSLEQKYASIGFFYVMSMFGILHRCWCMQSWRVSLPCCVTKLAYFNCWCVCVFASGWNLMHAVFRCCLRWSLCVVLFCTVNVFLYWSGLNTVRIRPKRQLFRDIYHCVSGLWVKGGISQRFRFLWCWVWIFNCLVVCYLTGCSICFVIVLCISIALISLLAM